MARHKQNKVRQVERLKGSVAVAKVYVFHIVVLSLSIVNKQSAPFYILALLLAPLLCLLRQQRRGGAICPPNGRTRWRNLRTEAGFAHWVPDVLRHSFASYHAKMYKNLPQLQLIMGHRDSQLLLTRYINMRGITKRDAQRFWQGVDRRLRKTPR